MATTTADAVGRMATTGRGRDEEGETHNNQIDHGGWVGVGSSNDNDDVDGGLMWGARWPPPDQIDDCEEDEAPQLWCLPLILALTAHLKLGPCPNILGASSTHA